MVEKICGKGEFWVWNGTVNVWWRVRVVSRWEVSSHKLSPLSPTPALLWPLNTATFSLVSQSHCTVHCTVVRECCKGDDASQWGNGKFDPLPPPNPLTDRHQNLSCTRYYVPHIYHMQKFSHDPLRGSFSLYAQNCSSKMFTRLLLFVGSSSNAPQLRPPNRFSRVIRQTTRLRARMCLFGVRKQKFNIYAP